MLAWQRPSNENTNDLLRHYFPMGADVSTHARAVLLRLGRELNRRAEQSSDFPGALLASQTNPLLQ